MIKINNQNELNKYYTDYCSNIRWSKKRQDKWLQHKNELIFMIAYLFAKTNKKFILEQIECLTNNLILK